MLSEIFTAKANANITTSNLRENKVHRPFLIHFVDLLFECDRHWENYLRL